MATQTKKISSNGPTFYGTGLKSAKKALCINFFENNAKVSIHSELPANMKTGTQVYDYKSGVEIYLKAKACKNLAKILKKAINYISEGNDFEPMSVPSGVQVIEVSDGSKFNLPTPGITIAIYSEINEERKTSKYEVYQFAVDKIMKNYDSITGTYDYDETTTEPEMMMDTLNDFSRASSCAEAHIIKREFAYDMNSIIARQIAVMDKLGIPNPYNHSSNENGGYTSGYGLNKASNSNWNSSSHGTAKSYASTDDVISDIGDMM